MSLSSSRPFVSTFGSVTFELILMSVCWWLLGRRVAWLVGRSVIISKLNCHAPIQALIRLACAQLKKKNTAESMKFS